MYVPTPLIRSVYFPHDVLLKLENTQPSGSFKSRGMTVYIQDAVKDKSDCHVYSSSGGNAGLAAAEAALGLNLPCTVVVPSTTKTRMIDRIKKLGAEVIVQGSMWSEADAYLRELIKENEAQGSTAVYCHPFDNPVIWKGHSTIIDELKEQIKIYGCQYPSAIVLSCGGGGLYMGVMKGLERAGWVDKVPVVVVETVGAPTFHESLAAGKEIRLKQIKTIANSLGSTYVPQEIVNYALKYKSRSLLVTDEQSVEAIQKFACDHCTIVEPACGATLSPIYNGQLAQYAENGPVIAIVCGGTSWGSVDGY